MCLHLTVQIIIYNYIFITVFHLNPYLYINMSKAVEKYYFKK